jgi:hypothetical protein
MMRGIWNREVRAVEAGMILLIAMSGAGCDDGYCRESDTKLKHCAVGGVDRCVRMDDPRQGCSDPSCLPCTPNNATAVCVHDKTDQSLYVCAVGGCADGYWDCNGDVQDGCEVNLESSNENCGHCGMNCASFLVSSSAASTKCVAGACRVGDCASGHLDCNLDPTDGCEVNKSTDGNNCGACGLRCDGGICSAGTCQ